MDDATPRLEDMVGDILNRRLRSVNAALADPTPSLVRQYRRYTARFSPVDFLEKRSLFCRFRQEFEWAARYSASERDRILLAVVCQAMDHGLPYVMAKVSPEAATFRHWAAQAMRELGKARGLIRLVPARSERLLVGRWRFRSFLVDVVLQHFQHRFPHHRVVIVDGPWAYLWEGGRLKREEAGPYLRCSSDQTFAPYWENYYESQNIAEQPRRSLAMRHLPKKYWSLVPEGAKIDRAGKGDNQEAPSAQPQLPL